MRKYPILQACWFAVNGLLLVSFVAVVYSVGWEFSTRSYLKGFSDAIVPASADALQKSEAILQWMAHGPGRRSQTDTGGLEARDPEDTLNIQQLLEVCGTATNAFVNLAQSSGLHARRLLLLDDRGLTKHVVVEVLDGERWVVVDPSYHFILRLPDGHFPNRVELRDPAVFQGATQVIANYPPIYTYENTVHLRLSRIPLVGKPMRAIFNYIWPSWEEAINWTLLVERESFATLVASIVLLCLAVVARVLLGWYSRAGLGIERERLRDQILRAGQIMVGSPR